MECMVPAILCSAFMDAVVHVYSSKVRMSMYIFVAALLTLGACARALR